jgi:hypothetical protein
VALKVSETFEIKKKSGLALEFTMKLDPGKLCEIRAQSSEEVENYFRQQGLQMGGDIQSSRIYSPLALYQRHNQSPRGRNWSTIVENESPFKLAPLEGKPFFNMCWLRAVDLSKGVRFQINWPLSAEEFATCKQGFRTSFIDFYGKFMAPLNATVRINIEEVE